MEYESVRDDDRSKELDAAALVEFEFDPARYEQFEHWIDSELECLIGRWKHLAAPNAVRGGPFKASRDR